MCQQNRDDMEHMLNFCLFAKQKWGQLQGVFKSMDQDCHDIKEMILLWHNNIISNPVLNQAWDLGVGLNLWAYEKKEIIEYSKIKYQAKYMYGKELLETSGKLY